MRFIYFVIYALLFFISVSCNEKKDNKPVDFDHFWNETLIELNGVPLEVEKIGKDSIIENKKLSLYRIRSFKNIYFYSWVSEPVNEGKYPVIIRFSGFGEGVSNIDSIPHVWFLKQKKTINMIVDIRGQGLSTDQISFENYLTNGINSKENYIYRGAYMDAVRAVNFISQNQRSNGNIIVTGGSQGGSLSIAAAALNNKVTMCIAGFPFLNSIPDYDKRKWPMNIMIHHCIRNDIDYDDLKNTLMYFDIINFSDRIKVPILIKTGEIDEIIPQKGTQKLFNSIKGQKKLMYVDPCKGHGCVSNSPVANKIEKTFIDNNLLQNPL